ncbi:allantoicase, partial [Escherichia coli]|uniref:hypothetical protein n=1 Tax=Escherichia coli TaxID=562 RepID=UPI000FF47D06
MNAEHAPFRHYLDLADARLGSQVVAVSDEWFAPASRMLQAGNHPPAASLDGCCCAEGDPDDSTSWSEVLPAVGLQGDSHHYHPIDDERPWT